MQENEIDRIIDKVITEVTGKSPSGGQNPLSIQNGDDLAGKIDHTILKSDATRDNIIQLCNEARQYGFVAVCVNPCWVRTASEQLYGGDVMVCSVVGFPLGANTSCLKEEETRRAISDGAREIDMVLNVGKFKSGDLEFVHNDIKRVVDAANPAHVKVIIETCLLTDEEKVAACVIAKQAGAHFVKTSTGFSKAGAKIEDVALMRKVVGDSMGVKAAGGIRDRQTVEAMIRAGANRIGTSNSVAIVRGV
ncbi:deoxyribose-phosphate aldolase [candidate division KSB1 bacterium]|nr:deoxyribose-phosphate aldolase [candidate division KSB1 bacterium]